jgi:hypothetical protein
MCAECHSTQIELGYDAKDDSFDTSYGPLACRHAQYDSIAPPAMRSIAPTAPDPLRKNSGNGSYKRALFVRTRQGGSMASGSLDRFNNLFIHLLDAVGREKQTVQPAPTRTSTLRRATPGLIVALLVWSLVFVLSIGTNGALAAAIAQHLTLPQAVVDAFSSLAGARDPEPESELTALVVSPAVPAIDHFQHSGLPPVAGKGSALASSILAHIPKRSPGHGGLLGLDFLRALANNPPLDVDVSAHPDAWTHGGVANLIRVTAPAQAGRMVRGRSNDTVSDRGSDDAQAPVLQIAVTPYANDPTIDSVPWAKPTPDTGPARSQPIDKLVTFDDSLPTLAPPPTSLTRDDLLPTDSVLEPRLAVDFAEPVAALVATLVPAPGTIGLFAGALLAWPTAKRMRIGSTRRTRSISSTSPRD